jgi:DNA-binding response OmpR family regulator
MSTQPTVVVIEDDDAIADLVDAYLREAGFRPLLAATGERGLELISQHGPACVICDLGLPGIDGTEVCRTVRAANNGTAIVMLTARSSEDDRITGLELGADDYVTKPFSPRELVARVKAVLRRLDEQRSTGAPTRVEVDGIVIDLSARTVLVDGADVGLAAKEFDLLAHFCVNRGRALTRGQLLSSVWGEEWEGDERTVDTHVRQLRKKVGDGLPLVTVWGVGYRFGA